MSELHPTSFYNMLSHDNMIEQCSSEHIKINKKGKKDEKKCKLQKKEENKARTIILNCRNVKGGWNLSIYPLLNPYAPRQGCYRVFKNQETNLLFLLQTDIYRPCRKTTTNS